jgi:hypothetical protein
MIPDFNFEELDSGIEGRATRLLAKHRFYFSRFVPDVILTVKFKRRRYVGPTRLRKELDVRMRVLEQSVQHPIAWAIVDDAGRSGRLLRFHLLISGTDNISSYREWEFKAPHECVQRRITWTGAHGTALFLAKNGISESNEFQFGGGLIEDDPVTPAEMLHHAVNPSRKVERDHIALGSDPGCEASYIPRRFAGGSQSLQRTRPFSWQGA